MGVDTVVILIHGIRTAARWQNRVAAKLEKAAGVTVIPLKYGYFDLLRFWCPFGVCRQGPIERLRKQIEGIREAHPKARLVVFAHSFGTYALSRILMDNPYFKFDRILLCGSIIPENYDWSRVENQIRADDKRDAIINDCGTRDVWPVFAKSVSWGYGASGTYGFGSFNVRDRFHPFTHSQFFDEDFVAKYWVPAVTGAKAEFSPGDLQEAKSPGWFNLLQLPLKWPLAAAPFAIVALLALQQYQAVSRCPQGQELRAGVCVDTAGLQSRDVLQKRVRTILADIGATLDIKGGELFPAMDEYVSRPTPEKWREISGIVLKLLRHLDKSLADITQYNAHLIAAGDKYILLTSDATIFVDEKFYQAFEKARQHFRGRSTLLNEMESAGTLPETASVLKWKEKLQILHDELQGTLQPFSNLLDHA